MKMFVTYGYGTKLRNKFSVVEGENTAECQQKIRETCQAAYAFSYYETDFQKQLETYGLEEVPLQPCSAYRIEDSYSYNNPKEQAPEEHSDADLSD